MRIMGLDYGDVRIGIAVSDLTGMIAQSVGVISGRDEEKRMAELDLYIKEYNPSEIVLGYPLNMNGTKGERAEKSEIFELFDHAVDICKNHNLLKSDDIAVITSGVPIGISGTTNIIKVEVIE